MKETKPGRGGRRQGAGRKLIGRECRRSLTIRIEPTVYDILEQIACKQGVSKGVLVEQLIKNAFSCEKTSQRSAER